MTVRRIAICREGVYYLLVAIFIVAGAVFSDENLLVMLAGLMFGPLLFNWRFVVMTVRGVELRRNFPKRICAGDPLLVEVLASNQRLRLSSWTLEVRDHIQRCGALADEPPAAVDIVFPHVAAGQTASVSYRLLLTRRGRYRLGPFRVATRFPLGLVKASMSVEAEDQILVCPRLGRLSRQWDQLIETDRMGGERSRRRQGFLEGDYYGLREWRAGDSPRWIHWRTSAKLGNLAVRQFEQQRNRDVALALDLWQPAHPTLREQGHSEVAASFVATAIADLGRRGGNRIMLGIAGQTRRRLTAASASTLFVQDCLEQLATIQAAHRNHLPELLHQLFSEVRPGTRVIIVSTRPAPAELESFRAARQPQLEGAIWINVSDETSLSQLYNISG